MKQNREKWVRSSKYLLAKEIENDLILSRENKPPTCCLPIEIRELIYSKSLIHLPMEIRELIYSEEVILKAIRMRKKNHIKKLIELYDEKMCIVKKQLITEGILMEDDTYETVKEQLTTEGIISNEDNTHKTAKKLLITEGILMEIDVYEIVKEQLITERILMESDTYELMTLENMSNIEEEQEFYCLMKIIKNNKEGKRYKSEKKDFKKNLSLQLKVANYRIFNLISRTKELNRQMSEIIKNFQSIRNPNLRRNMTALNIIRNSVNFRGITNIDTLLKIHARTTKRLYKIEESMPIFKEKARKEANKAKLYLKEKFESDKTSINYLRNKIIDKSETDEEIREANETLYSLLSPSYSYFDKTVLEKQILNEEMKKYCAYLVKEEKTDVENFRNFIQRSATIDVNNLSFFNTCLLVYNYDDWGTVLYDHDNINWDTWNTFDHINYIKYAEKERKEMFITALNNFSYKVYIIFANLSTFCFFYLLGDLWARWVIRRNKTYIKKNQKSVKYIRNLRKKNLLY